MLRLIVTKFGIGFGFLLLACCFAHGQTPTISSISPNPVGIGQSATISGSNFGTSGTVKFHGVTASTTSWTATAIIATVPVGATNGNVVVTSGGQSSSGFPFTLNNGPVNYVYDDLGRLVEASDINGTAAEYSYDAVGNILSISHYSSSHVSIANFSPENGPVGTVVTISGTGFSMTPSQDTVKFHGVAATVSSATSTQLQVTVPTAATTGPVFVSSPNGSATTTTNFTVTSSNGIPTITSFSPPSGIAGTTINLVGTNFDPTLANDKLRMNASPAVVSAVTPTTMGTTVPAATASGRFTLIAPAGSAVSAPDFYVPFLNHSPGDIGFTARITPGGSQPVTLSANQIALVLFDGMEGQHFSVGITGSSFPNCTLYLISPSNPDPDYEFGSCLGNTYFGPEQLTQNGTYTIGVDPGAIGGSLTMMLTEDFLGTIAINGPTVTATTTESWQDALLTFEATGQRVAVYATNVTNPGTTLYIVAPNQTTLTQSVYITNNPPGQVFFIDSQILGFGTYQLWVPHNGIAGSSSETLQIVGVPPDVSQTLTVPAAGTTGLPVAVPLVAGQNASLTFSGTAGQKLSFNVSSTIGTTLTSCVLTVYDANNSSIATGNCGNGASYVDTVTLALTNTYTVFVNPQGAAAGSASISINNDQDVTTPVISIGGSAITTATTVAGQDVRLSFTPTSSQPRIAVLVGNVTNPYASLNLVTPAGSTQPLATLWINNSPSGQMFFLDTQAVNANQQYQLWVQHSGTNFGSETLQLKSVPADGSHTVTVGGSAFSFSTVAGQNVNIGFSINQSEHVTVQWTGGTYPSSPACNITVTGPSPSTNVVGSGYCNAATGTVSLGNLSSGTYNILVDPQAQSAGGMTLSVTSP